MKEELQDWFNEIILYFKEDWRLALYASLIGGVGVAGAVAGGLAGLLYLVTR